MGNTILVCLPPSVKVKGQLSLSKSSPPWGPLSKGRNSHGYAASGRGATPGIRSLAFHFLWVLHSWVLAAPFFIFLSFIENSGRALRFRALEQFGITAVAIQQALGIVCDTCGLLSQRGARPSLAALAGCTADVRAVPAHHQPAAPVC